MDRSNHYETAVEAYLRDLRLCYVAVDESRRSLLSDGPVKSLDFIVHSESGARLLIDVKGRRYPGGRAERPRRVWECWSTLDDVTGLEQWEQRFGTGYQGLLLFTYLLGADEPPPVNLGDVWLWRDRRYLLRAVAAADYRRHMRSRSPRWGTVSLPTYVFARLSRPFHCFLQDPAETTARRDWQAVPSA